VRTAAPCGVKRLPFNHLHRGIDPSQRDITPDCLVVRVEMVYRIQTPTPSVLFATCRWVRTVQVNFTTMKQRRRSVIEIVDAGE